MRLRAASVLLLSACAFDAGALEARLFKRLYDEALEEEKIDYVLPYLLGEDEVVGAAMLRNACARRLCELGVNEAAAVLIANLDRDSRTFVATDAIYHLRELFGTDHGYNPNLGYRHQTKKQQEWWDWFAQQHFEKTRPPTPDGSAAIWDVFLQELPGPRASSTEPEPDLRRWKRTDWTHAEILQGWTELAAKGKSRDPADVRVMRVAFGSFARAWPRNVDLWNNHALFALNDGEWAEAEESYRRAIQLRLQDANLRNDYGILLEGLGRLEDAETQYRIATRLKWNDDIAYANLGDVLAAQGKTKEAVAAYRQAERLAPNKWYYHRLWIGRLVADKP